MNVGVLGSGFIVPEFVETTKLFKEFKLVGIWGRHQEKIDQFQDFEYRTTDLEKILNDPKIDVIYIGLPNGLHYEYAYKALKAGKHVILEKPFCSNYKDAKKLIDFAHKQNLIIFEAIMNIHMDSYQEMKKHVKELGDIKIVDANFSQYSRRYDRFKNGEILPVFNKKLAGGSLLDLGVYNVHYIYGIFGKPKNVKYYPNMEKGVDTSGILVMDYGKFKAISINAKDCGANSHVTIQGDKGYLHLQTTSSRCGTYSITLNKQKPEVFEGEDDEFAGWKYEMRDFIKIYNKNDFEEAYRLNQITLEVMKILDKALKSADINY